MPNADKVVGITGEQSLAIGRPGHRQTLRRIGAAVAGDFRSEFIDLVLGFEIPDFDAGAGGGAKPITVGREGQRVDRIGVIQRVQMFAVIQIPKHGLGVLAAGSAQRTVRRHRDGVQIAGVTDVVGLQLAVSQVPYLDVFVPAARDDDGVLVVGGETDAAHPITVTFFLDGVFTLGQGIPQFDGLVPGSGNDLTVIGRKSDAHYILGVVFEAAGRLTGGQIPKTKGFVPRAGQSEMSIGRQNDVGDEMTVSVETFLRNTVVHFIAGKLPNDEGLIPGGGKDHFRVFGVGGDLGNPSIVSGKGSAKLESLRHD